MTLRGALALVALLAASCRDALERDSVGIVLPNDVLSLDPNAAVEQSTDAVLANVFESLVGFDANLRVEPVPNAAGVFPPLLGTGPYRLRRWEPGVPGGGEVRRLPGSAASRARGGLLPGPFAWGPAGPADSRHGGHRARRTRPDAGALRA